MTKPNQPPETTVMECDRKKTDRIIEYIRIAHVILEKNTEFVEADAILLAAEIAAAREEERRKWEIALGAEDLEYESIESILKWYWRKAELRMEEKLLTPSPCGKPGHFKAHWVEGDYDLSKSYTHSQARHLGYGYCTLCQQQESAIKPLVDAYKKSVWELHLLHNLGIPLEKMKSFRECNYAPCIAAQAALKAQEEK